MPLAYLTRSLLASIASGAVGTLYRMVSLNGFKYGSQGEVPGAPGISSSSPRSSPTDTLLSAGLDWRGLAGSVPTRPALSKVGPVPTSLDRGQEFSFEWTPVGNTEDIVGSLPQADVLYGVIQKDVPTTCDHGYVVDSCGVSSVGLNGFTQKVTPGGSLAGRTFTFSVWAAVPTPLARSFAQNITLTLMTSADPPASPAESGSLATSYAIGRTTYIRATVTYTFTTANTEIQVVGRATPVGGVTLPLLFAAAQLEEAGAATAYERTGSVRGVRNLLLGSHFPTRAPWTTRVASGSVKIVPDAGRGPEVRAIPPTPGAIEFGMAVTGVNVGNGLCQLKPYDAYGLIANKLVSGASATTWGAYRTVAADPKGKTVIVSAFVRNTGSNISPDVSLQLCPMNGGTQLGATSQSVGAPPRTWRRVWWSRYIDGSVFPTANGLQAFFFTNNTAAGKEIEWTGLMIEYVSGNNPQPPSDYERVGSGTGAVNLLQYTEDLSNGYWSRQNLASVTNGSGYGPIEYYDVLHPDFGKSSNRLRINPGGLNVLTDDWHAGTAGDKGDFTGEAYSVGGYGTEVMGSAGDFPWRLGSLVGSWVVTGGSSNFVETDGAPEAFTDDEEAGPWAPSTAYVAGFATVINGGNWYLCITSGTSAGSGGPTGTASNITDGSAHWQFIGLVSKGVHHYGDGAAARYASNTFTLAAAGWVTVRLRVARNANGNGAKLALLNPGGNYAGYDRVQWPDGTIRWLRCASRKQGLNSPDYGVSVWHVYCPSSGTYTLRLAGENTGTPYEVWWDQLRVWTDAGALYPCTDRTETLGNCGFLIQGLNVLFRGVVDDSVQADDTSISVRCVDYIHGTQQELPSWTTQPNCQVKFRGQQCGYTAQVDLDGTPLTFTAEGSPTTTHTLATGTTATLQPLRFILKPDGVNYTTILTILNSAQFTTTDALQYSGGAALSYADCKRVYPDCYLRRRTHRYSGCRATQALQAMGGTPLYHSQWLSIRNSNGWPTLQRTLVQSTAAQLLGAVSITAESTLSDRSVYDETAVPLVYGRRSVKCIPVETHATRFASDSSEWLTTFYLIGMGEIAGVRQFFTPDGPIVQNGNAAAWQGSHGYATGVDAVSNDNGKVYICVQSGTSAGSGGPTGTGSAIADGTVVWDYLAASPFGVLTFWHPGRQGTDGWWTLTEQYTAGAELIQKIDNQDRDFRTNTDNAYNQMAYAITQIRKGNPLVDLTDPTKIVELWADVKGRLVQVYDRTGAPVGSPAWSRNPIWIAVDAMLNDVFGPGLPPSLINWAVMADSAAFCDTVITSATALSQVRSGPLAGITSSVQGFVGIDGFAPEMNVTITAAPTSPTYPSVITRKIMFVDPINLRLFFDSSCTLYSGDVIQGLPARFTCDIAVTSKLGLPQFLDTVMGTCRGFLGFDGGRIGIHIDKSQADTSATTFAIANPTPAATLLGVIPNTVQYNQRRGSGSTYNALEITYPNAQMLASTPRVLKFYDADRGGLDFPRPLKIEAAGCDTGDQALRAMLPRAAKSFSAVGGLDPTQDARGVTVKSGISLLQAQLGDFFTLTRQYRTTSQRSRISSITVDENLEVSVSALPEIRMIRGEGFSAPFDPYTDAPLVGSAMGTQLPAAAITIAVVQSAAGQLHASISLSGYAAGPGASASANLQKFVAYELHHSLVPNFLPTTGALFMGGTLCAVADGTVSEIVWDVPRTLQEKQLYVKVVGLQGAYDLNPVMSNEIPIVIYRVDDTTIDPTQRQRSSDANMIYDGDFNNGDPAATPIAGWDVEGVAATYGTGSGTAYTGNLQFPANELTPDVSGLTGAAYGTAAVANVVDNSDATLNSGAATNGIGTHLRTIKYYNFGAGSGSHIGRPYIRGAMVGVTTGGSVQYYYTLDRTAGSPLWVLWVTIVPTGAAADYFGPEVTADYAKYGIKASVVWSRPPATTITDSHYRVAFDQRNSPAYYGQVNAGKATIQGDGTNYGAVVRAFPGGNPEDQTVFTPGTTNSCEIRLKKNNSGDTLDTGLTKGVIVELEDQATGTKWTLLTVDPADITAAWQAFRVQFAVGSAVTGSLVIRVKTKNSKPIDCDKVGVFRGDQIGAWLPSPQEMANGFYGDFSMGDITGFTHGTWALGHYKKSPVA